MADSDALRARRARLHRKGDHTLCVPGRCRELAPPTPATAAVSAVEPAERAYGPRGQKLWDEMAGTALGPTHRLLLEEACRIADRLDHLDQLIGQGHIALMTEARQQTTALRGIVAELRSGAPKAKAPKTAAAAAAAASGAGAPPKEGSGLGDLAANVVALRRPAPPAG